MKEREPEDNCKGGHCQREEHSIQGETSRFALPQAESPGPDREQEEVVKVGRQRRVSWECRSQRRSQPARG